MEAVTRLSGRRASPSLSFTSDINKDMKEAATSSITPVRQCIGDKDLVLLFPFIVKPAHFVTNINESLETFTLRIPVQTVELPFLAALFPVVVSTSKWRLSR